MNPSEPTLAASRVTPRLNIFLTLAGLWIGFFQWSSSDALKPRRTNLDALLPDNPIAQLAILGPGLILAFVLPAICLYQVWNRFLISVVPLRTITFSESYATILVLWIISPGS